MLVTNEQLKSLTRDFINGEHYHIVSSFKQSVSTTVLEDLWLVPGVSVIPYPNGQQLAISSDSANDNSIGTGTRTIDLHYLDTSYIEHSEFITLNGLTPVNTIATNIHRILDFHSQTVGSGGTTAGNISLKNLAGTVTYDYLQAGGNQTLTGAFTVPIGMVGYVTGWQGSSTKQAVSVRLRITRARHDGELLPGIFCFHDIVNVNNSTSGQISFATPIKCPAKTDIKISAIGTGAAGGDCSGSFAIILLNQL